VRFIPFNEIREFIAVIIVMKHRSAGSQIIPVMLGCIASVHKGQEIYVIINKDLRIEPT
jgi:ribosomal protein S19